MTTVVAVEHFTDPFSPWCWAAQPTLRRLRYEFEGVEWTPRMTVLLPDSPSDRLPDGVEDAGDARTRWAEAAGSTGMPVAEALWTDGLPSSRPACAAVAFVREVHPESALAVLRRLREAAFAEGRAVESPNEIAAVAGRAEGVERSTVRRALEDGRAVDALGADLARAVEVAEELGGVEVRGDVSVVSAAPGLPSLPSTSEPSEEPDGASPDGNGGDESNDQIADDEKGGEDGQGKTVLVGPPALRVEVEAGEVTVVDPRLPFGRLASAFGRSVPRTGIEIDDKYATSRMAMHVPREVAESLSSEDFGSRVRPYLATVERAYLPEIEAGTGVSAETCVAALETLVDRGEAERVGPAEWRIVDDRGTPRGHT